MLRLDHAHHDGSERYVADAAPDLGDRVPVWVRVPHTAGVGHVHVRTTPDAEPHFEAATIDRTTETETWWRAEVRVVNPTTGYRFLLDGGPAGYQWLHAGGVSQHDVPDTTDFTLSTASPPPPWLADRWVYQVFPDRFARSGQERHWPDWANVAAWDDPIDNRRGMPVLQTYGGDLPGVEAHLDHLDRLGVNALYLNPVFPARSSHRYDATTFDHVDPLLGGDEALSALVTACHRRDIKVIGDLTVNHTGNHHEWFEAAERDAGSDEATYYTFRHHPDDYVAWFDVPSLPKLDLRQPGLRRRLLDGPESVVARYLGAPFDLDGWRVDVANMAGRLGAVDVNHEVARLMRATMAAAKPDTWLLAEHAHDAHLDLGGQGWHGTMSYAGFTRPVWCWLGAAQPDRTFLGVPAAVPHLGGPAVVATMEAFAAIVPWRSRAASMVLLDSHDTARFRSICGDPRLVEVGIGLQATLPGVPSTFAGDEVGVEGTDTNLARGPMPWDEAGWDHALLAVHQGLVALRRHEHALRHGGLRWVHVDDDVLVFERESQQQRLLVQVARASHRPVRLPSVSYRGASAVHGDAAVSYESDEVCLPGDGPAVRVWEIEP